MDYRGYSKRIVDANYKASTDSLGILLGRYCIQNDISASYIAGRFGVSRMTIYNWFTGKSEPRARYRTPIERYLREEAEKILQKQ